MSQGAELIKCVAVWRERAFVVPFEESGLIANISPEKRLWLRVIELYVSDLRSSLKDLRDRRALANAYATPLESIRKILLGGLELPVDAVDRCMEVVKVMREEAAEKMGDRVGEILWEASQKEEMGKVFVALRRKGFCPYKDSQKAEYREARDRLIKVRKRRMNNV